MTDEAIGDVLETRTNGVGGVDTGAAAAVHEAARELGAQEAEVGEQAYRQARDAGRYAGRQVEEQPWTAVIATGLLSLAIGFLLGRGSAPAPRTARDYVEDYLPQKLRRH